ncbi:uncharacterized protein N7479_001724 [Penicillium vulpinum]|uniref:uncharacterized protein n=1 Tax=Penicillium vulpinum TaxID=29845 RepID=UPI002548DF7B|nr:uncharacterized protein N7479_001724 [Penicillium vulpinum]KAJ5971806.1 hypothetical protein N7479_001724 [Penicillium vulpinum]
MHCLSSASIRSLFPNWVQTFWISEVEQNRERLEQSMPYVASPYTRTEPAVYQLQNTEVKKRPPIYNSNQTNKEILSRVGPFKGYSTNRSRNVSTQSDGNTDGEVIVLPHIPPNIRLVKGRIIGVRTRSTDYFDWPSPTFEKIALSRRDGPPIGLLLI